MTSLHACRASVPSFVGEVVQYEDSYRLCYLRGPEGIIIALAEPLSQGRVCRRTSGT